MMKSQQAPVAKPTLAQIQGYIAELEEAPPFARQLGLATLLVSEINRIRFYMEAQGTYNKLLELRLDASTAEVEPELSWRAMFKKIVHDLAPLQTDPDTLEDLDIAFGFIVHNRERPWLHDDADRPFLQGQDLSTLTAATAPDEPAPDFDLPCDHDYLTANAAAKLLGVNKSTVTRRIKNDQIIGFRVFKKALRIPRDQFMDGDVVEGVARILTLFVTKTEDGGAELDHKRAWDFLGSTLYAGDSAPRPIDRLRDAVKQRRTSTVLAELALAKRSYDYGDHI